MKKIPKMSLIFLVFLPIFFCFISNQGECQERLSREKIISSFTDKIPRQWGEKVTGVRTRLNTDQKRIALTFDACGGPNGNGYDTELINYLKNEKIPATLFLSGKWMNTNPERVKELAKEPLFEIQNHGLNHKPCSANGRSAYGIAGTKGADGIFDEIEQNAIKIQNFTGRKPRYYRPGTAHSDEICVEIAQALGHEVANFSVRGDAGATYTKNQVKEVLLNARPSSIILLHMNHPEGETAEGLMEAIPELKKHGFGFVKLLECDLK